MPMHLEPRQRYVEHGRDCEGGGVPDGLHPGDGPLSLQEHVHPVPQAQLVPLLYLWVPQQRHPHIMYRIYFPNKVG